MTAVLASFFSDIEKNFERFVMNCLAVAGAYVVAYIVSGLLIGALDKYALKKKTPDFVKKSVRVLTGIVVALLVALYLFRGFGSGGEGPGGPGTGTGDSKNENKGSEPPQPAPKDKPTPDPIPPVTSSSGETTVTVSFMGGSNVQNQKAYLLVKDQPLTFDQLKEEILKRRKAEPHGIKLAFGRVGSEKVSFESEDVKAVERWAREQKLIYNWLPDSP